MKIQYTYNPKKKINFFAKIIVLTLAILVAAYLVPGVHVESVLAAILASVVVALLNIFLRPILIVLTLPFTLFSMGIFLLFINAFIVYLTALIIPGIEVESFWWALLFSIVITIVNSLLEIPEKLLSGKTEIDEDDSAKDYLDDRNDFDEYDDVTEDSQEENKE